MALSRHAEYRADEQAVKEGYGEQLISRLKTLYKEDLGDLNPDPLVVLLSYSHPTLAQRIRHIREFERATIRTFFQILDSYALLEYINYK